MANWDPSVRTVEQAVIPDLPSLLEDTSEPMVAFRLDGSFWTCNQAFANLLGYGQINVNEFFPPSLIIFCDDIAQVLKQDTICSRFENKFIADDGRELCLSIIIMRQHDAHNQPTCYLANIHDITPQKEAEAVLRLSEEQYRLIAENAYDMITIIDTNSSRYKYISPSHERILGFSVGNLMDKPWYELIHPDDLPETAQAFYEGLLSGSGQAIYRHLNSKGEYVWLQSAGIMLRETAYQGNVLLVARDFTEQKMIELALKRSEEKYRLIVDNAYDGISIIDAVNFSTLYQNPAFYQMLGYSNEEWHDKSLLDIVHPEDLGLVRQRLNQNMKDWEGSLQCRLRKKDASFIWAEITATAMSSEDNNMQWLFICRDISERKLSEEQLRRSEEKYRLIADHTQDLILLINPRSMKCTYASPSSSKILGYREEELFGINILDQVHREDRGHVLQLSSLITAYNVEGVQHRLRRKDGSYLWVESIGKMFKNTEGFWQVLISTRDISIRKQSENALKASEARLMESEKELKYRVDYLNYLINNMNEVFATYDREQLITFVNSGIKKSLGYEPDELIGQPALILVSPSQRGKIARQIEHRLRYGGTATFETLFAHKDGSEVLVRVKSAPIIENGVINGVTVLLEDISEYRKMEKEMARLDQLNTVGEMAAGIGHEIRNPMTTVKGFLQLLGQDEGLLHYNDYFNIMMEELERANAIISEFLSLAKDKLVNLQLHNLNHLITAIYPLLRADAILSDKNVLLDLSDIPDLLVDEAEIRQLLLNLVRNGLEAMEAGGKVYIETYQEGPEVILAVRDEGSGIDSSLLDKLGTPFLTTKEEGTGLGLAICYSIVVRHNAIIEPITGPDGTTIRIHFNVPGQETDL